jgi:hypothetical protein
MIDPTRIRFEIGGATHRPHVTTFGVVQYVRFPCETTFIRVIGVKYRKIQYTSIIEVFYFIQPL